MPGVKTIPIKDDEGNVVGQKFGPSKSFTDAIEQNYVPMQDAAGRSIRANKKITQHYVDKGYGPAGAQGRGAKEAS